MQRIPVTKDGKKGSEIIIINSDEVLKIEKSKDDQLIVHTEDDEYYLDFSFESIEEWLFEDGFRMLDSTNIVNMHQIKHYDDKKGLIYFGNVQHKNTKTATAARIHKNHIHNVLEMIRIAREDQSKQEYQDFRSIELIKKIIEQDADDRFLRSYATIQAVNERIKAEEKIIHMAYHDALTNLPNRLLFHDHLHQLLAESGQEGKLAAVLYIDLDRFKVINDTLGHPAGDELLKHIGKKLSDSLTEDAIVARFSGDEFVILLPDLNHVDEATHFAKNMLQQLSEPFFYQGHELFITASVGISLYPTDGTDAHILIKNADTAMYRAKEKGGNTYQVYQSEMNIFSMKRLHLENSLRKAITNEEFVVYYQPLLDLQTGKICGMESLVRWKHPSEGFIPPRDFIPIAEETGLIIPIGDWILNEACRQNKKWVDMELGPLTVSVNISANQFHRPNFVQTVEKALEKSGMDPRLLCLEITENVAMKNISYIISTIAKLKNLGIQISIDDFGTGYSSLGYLKRFHVHTLKIDKSFIKDINRDEDNAAIVMALIAMSRQLKIHTLAEGVETYEQLEFLKQYGCDKIQGFIFSEPLPADKFEQLLRENRTLDYIGK